MAVLMKFAFILLLLVSLYEKQLILSEQINRFKLFIQQTLWLCCSTHSTGTGFQHNIFTVLIPVQNHRLLDQKVTELNLMCLLKVKLPVVLVFYPYKVCLILFRYWTQTRPKLFFLLPGSPAVLRIHISFHLDPDPRSKPTPFGSRSRKGKLCKLLVTSMIFKTLEVQS